MSEPFDLDKYRSIGVIKPATRAVNAKDKKLEKDRDSYKRLRANGIQPPHVGGSDHLEKHASLPIEVEMGHVFRTLVGKSLATEGVERSQELGF